LDLRSVYPFWLLEKGIIKSYPSVQQNLKADVVIMGAGISGALVSWYLRNTGYSVIIVDRRHVGMGSTAATTGLIQYEIDTPLTELQKKVGKQAAIQSYQLCNQAIHDLDKICRRFSAAEFTRKPSFQYASWNKDIPMLRTEYQERRNIGIEVQLLNSDQIKSKFGFDKQAGLLSKNAAELNAYGLTHSLLEQASKKNLAIYDHTNIKTIRHQGNRFNLYTDEGYKINAKYLIMACGYESSNYINKKVNELHSTYAIVSEPLASNQFWYKNAVIWETATPYLYLRTTADNRILIGGKDDDFSSGSKRDKALTRKAIELEKSFKKLFPRIAFKTDFKWAGLFASTKDGLPYIGSIPGKENMYFALGYGGNGILFSVIAAQVIRDLLAGKKNQAELLFSFNR